MPPRRSRANMHGLAQDFRYALRQLRKNPGFTTVAALTLALGIGANTAIFSVVNAVLLNPLPFQNANRIVSLFEATPNFPQGSISYPNFLDWQRDNRAFEAMAAFHWTDGAITGVGEAEQVHAERVSATFFPILGVNPILGRNFTPEEDRRGANPTALISEGLWKRKFNRDPNVIGKRLIVGGQGRTIVGVIPASFRLNIWNFQTSDVYKPIGEDTDQAFFQRDTYNGMEAIGLLKPGVTLAQARDDMKRGQCRSGRRLSEGGWQDSSQPHDFEGRDGRRHAAGATCAVRRGRICTVDRLRECRQSPPRPGNLAPARVFGSCRARRRSDTDSAPIADRKRFALVVGRRVRPDSRQVGNDRGPGCCAGNRPARRGDRAESPGPLVYLVDLRSYGNRVRIVASY